MKQQTQQTVQHWGELAQVKGGYVVAGGLGSTPLWVSTLTDVAQLVAVLTAIAVGVTTFYMNMKRIKYYKNQEENVKKGKK
jgi:hypothetical protein